MESTSLRMEMFMKAVSKTECKDPVKTTSQLRIIDRFHGKGTIHFKGAGSYEAMWNEGLATDVTSQSRFTLTNFKGELHFCRWIKF